MGPTTVKLALWAAPRSYSTLFERSMLQIKNSHAFHEPFLPAYYHGPQRQSKFFHSPENEEKSYGNIIKQLVNTMNDIENSNEQVSLFFIKDMAKHISNHFDEITSSLNDFQHSFLIRHPKETIRSLYHDLINGIKIGTDEFDVEECVESFKQLYEFYEYLRKRGEQKFVPLIDSDDLVNHPSHVMYEYCTRFKLPYNAPMLSWYATTELSGWQVWNGITSVDLKSGGLDKIPKSAADVKDQMKYPKQVEEAINLSLPYYEKLLKYKWNLKM